MKRIYLILAIIGFILPNLLVVKVSLETGNWLLYARPLETFQELFANDISSIFAIDLFYVVLLFFWASYREAKRLGMKNWFGVVLLTMAFGLAGGLPLFFYWRAKHQEANIS